VGIEVAPIKGRAAAEKCLLILFETDGVPARAERRSSSPPYVDTASADAKELEIARLGQALAQTTEYLHTLVREHEAALEELQSTNEEALSGNEELQSVNEELQTAKEEIQSANEELATLNQELQDRNVQLARSNDEIQRALDSANALVDTVRQPLVSSTATCASRRPTSPSTRPSRWSPGRTRGRLLSELGGGEWDKHGLLAALRDVLASDTAIEDLEVEAEFPTIGLRTMSLNARRLHPPLTPATGEGSSGDASSSPSRTARRSSGPSEPGRRCSAWSTTPANGPRRRTTSRTSSWPPFPTSCGGRSPSSPAG
jgi:two-component system CheB/CheR fusion protein